MLVCSVWPKGGIQINHELTSRQTDSHPHPVNERANDSARHHRLWGGARQQLGEVVTVSVIGFIVLSSFYSPASPILDVSCSLGFAQRWWWWWFAVKSNGFGIDTTRQKALPVPLHHHPEDGGREERKRENRRQCGGIEAKKKRVTNTRTATRRVNGWVPFRWHIL